MWVPFYHYILQYYFVCKSVQRKKHSKGNTARAQDQEACSFNSVTNPLWLISISCYMYLTIARPIPLEIPWVCPALWTSFEWSLDCSPWKFQEPSYLLGGFYSKRQCSDGKNAAAISTAVSMNTSVPTCAKQSLRGSLSTNPATGWYTFMPSENIFWGIFKCTVRHKFLRQQTRQEWNLHFLLLF